MSASRPNKSALLKKAKNNFEHWVNHGILWYDGIPRLSDDSTMTEAITFQAIQRSGTLSSRLVQQIETLIRQRHLQPGDRLPPERELALQFGVSRTVIREAVAALAAKNLLEALPGGGAVVRSPDAKSVSQSLSLFLHSSQETYSYAKVHEVRRLLEVEIAGLAAERRTEDDLRILEDVLQTLTASADRTQFAAHDVAFHAALAQATHNKLFVLLLDSLADVLLEVRERGFDVPGTPERAQQHHQAILDEVRRGDVSAARQAMQAHLEEADKTQQEALSRGPQTPGSVTRSHQGFSTPGS